MYQQICLASSTALHCPWNEDQIPSKGPPSGCSLSYVPLLELSPLLQPHELPVVSAMCPRASVPPHRLFPLPGMPFLCFFFGTLAPAFILQGPECVPPALGLSSQPQSRRRGFLFYVLCIFYSSSSLPTGCEPPKREQHFFFFLNNRH